LGEYLSAGLGTDRWVVVRVEESLLNEWVVLEVGLKMIGDGEA
jgi:hypothetical protein